MPRKSFCASNRSIGKIACFLLISVLFSVSLVAIFALFFMKNPALTLHFKVFSWVLLVLCALFCGVVSALFFESKFSISLVLSVMSGVLIEGVTLLFNKDANLANVLVRFTVFALSALAGIVLLNVVRNGHGDHRKITKKRGKKFRGR